MLVKGATDGSNYMYYGIYMNQCWLIFNEALCNSPEVIFTDSVLDVDH